MRLIPSLRTEVLKFSNKADPYTAKLQISEHLRFVNRQQPFYRLQFDNNLILNHHIHPIAAIEANGFVNYWQCHLSAKGQAALLDLIAQAFFISRFE